MAWQKSGFLSSLGILWEIWKALVNEVLDLGGSDDDLRRIQTNDGLRRKLAELIVAHREKAARTVKEWLSFWTTLYKEYFQLELDAANLKIPEQKPGSGWLIIVAHGLTPNQIFGVMRKLFPSWRYTEDLNAITSVRKTDTTYAIWVRARVEADEELKNKSANDLTREGMNCITLEERMLLEIMYFVMTGKHLDLKSWTLCAGSRDPDGHVPGVGWGPDDRRVGVVWTLPGFRSGGIRARAVVP